MNHNGQNEEWKENSGSPIYGWNVADAPLHRRQVLHNAIHCAGPRAVVDRLAYISDMNMNRYVRMTARLDLLWVYRSLQQSHMKF